MGIFEADDVRYVCIPVFRNCLNRLLFMGGKIIVSQKLYSEGHRMDYSYQNWILNTFIFSTSVSFCYIIEF